MRPITLILPLAASLAVSACAATPPVAGEPTGRCDVAAAKAFIGQNASPAMVEQARKAAGAEVVRTLDKDSVITMEYREGRLNLITDGGRIINATCS